MDFVANFSKKFGLLMIVCESLCPRNKTVRFICIDRSQGNALDAGFQWFI